MLKFLQKGKSRLFGKVVQAHAAIINKRAEGFVDTGVKILIAIVIGSLVLFGLYTLFGDTILPTLKTKIQELFNYSGTAS